MIYKKTRMNPQVLSVMTLGFTRSLFTQPNEKDILTMEVNNEHIIYYSESFWNQYVTELRQAKASGKFLSSNANSDWNELLNAVESVQNCEEPQNCKDYFPGLKYILILLGK